MAEGVSEDGEIVAQGVYDDPDNPPPPSAEAPRGWTWNRKEKRHQPRQRGPILWGPQQQENPQAPAAPAPGPDRDPDPAWMGGEQQQERRLSPEEVPQSVKDDIAGLAGLIGAPILAVLQQVDPYCGSALAQSFESVVDATLPLITRSAKIVRYFTDDHSDWLLWGKLAMALVVPAGAFAEHHILRTVRVERTEDGEVQVLRRTRAGEDAGDHLTPPAADNLQYAA